MVQSTKTVVVASNNPVKLKATRHGFEKMFPCGEFCFKTRSVPSGVSDQPMSSEETLTGALNRAHRVKSIHPEAQFWVGIEGGLQEVGADLEAFAWVVVLSPDNSGKSRTGGFFIPPKVAELVRGGMEMGYADDLVFKKTNSKQTTGATGILTHGAIDRAGFYEPSVILALIPFVNETLYPGDGNQLAN